MFNFEKTAEKPVYTVEIAIGDGNWKILDWINSELLSDAKIMKTAEDRCKAA